MLTCSPFTHPLESRLRADLFKVNDPSSMYLHGIYAQYSVKCDLMHMHIPESRTVGKTVLVLLTEMRISFIAPMSFDI
jgi:hypothetical protein